MPLLFLANSVFCFTIASKVVQPLLYSHAILRFNFQSTKMSLVKMPPELLAKICFSLPLSSIAALERTCSALRQGISLSGMCHTSSHVIFQNNEAQLASIGLKLIPKKQL